MTYKFSTLEEKLEHKRTMHTLACAAYNAKNKDKAKEKFNSGECEKRKRQSADVMALKLVLSKYAHYDHLFI